jgi:hypothetical protein
MKKLLVIIITFVGLGLMFSCEKELQDPKLDMSKTVKPAINSPAGGAAYVITQEEAENVLFTAQWSEAAYDLTNLETIKYALEMDLADSNFSNPRTLATGTGTSFEITGGQMNTTCISVWGLQAGVAYDVSLRVRSYVNTITDYSYAYSDVVTFSVTPYEEVVIVKQIYLLGAATPAGWDNTKAIPMASLGGGKYAIVETLLANDMMKFISRLGAWAPQWGTDATGTADAGPLVYRPDEGVADPAAIPTGDVAGSYYIEADTVGLTYKTFLTSGELYLVGDACTAGWDNANGIQFTEDSAHVFVLETTLFASGGLKFLEVPGAWAPQWGIVDGSVVGNTGRLSYRPSESVQDPPNVPAPDSEGTYVITVNLMKLEYTLEKK